MAFLQSFLPVAVITMLLFGLHTAALKNDTHSCPQTLGEMLIGFLPMKTVKSTRGAPTWPIEAIIETMDPGWDSYIPTPPKKSVICQAYGTCYNATFVNINYPEEEWGYKDIYNKQTLADLEYVDLVVGHYLPAVERYCKAKKLAYILSLPPSIDLEDRMLAENNSERVMFSAWPSWKNFVALSAKALEASRKNRKMNPSTIGRVFIWVEGPDAELNAIANKLAEVLMLPEGTGVRADAVFVRMYDIQRMESVSFYEIQAYIFRIIKQFEADIVVYMYKLEYKLWPIIEAFRWMSRMYFPAIEEAKDRIDWVFWDMRTDFNGILSQLVSTKGFEFAESLRLRSIGLYNAKPFGLSCDNITTDLSEMVGANDAASMAMLNAATIAEPDFTRAKLLETMRETKFYLAGVKSRQQDNWVNIYSGWSFEYGFRVYAAVSIGLAIPNTSYSEAGHEDHGHDSYASATQAAPERPDVYRDCKPKLEYFLSYYWDDKLQKVVSYIEPQEIQQKPDDSTMKIVAVLEEPFVMAKGGQNGKDAGYTGIAHAILTEAFRRMALRTGWVYKYTIYHTAGNEYGRFNHSTKTWTGAFGELQQKKAVMAIGMISKTILRARDFDFSPPFEFVGITFIVKLARRTADLDAFMMPFKYIVWWGLLAVMLFSCVFINLLDRWNPYMEEIEPEKRFNMNESTWYSFGTITGAGGEFAPIMHPTRIYSVFYWFFALVVTACYTGNLASFLVEQDTTFHLGGISDIPYLAKSSLKWGTLKGSYMEQQIRGNSSTHDLTDLAKKLNYDRDYKEGTDRAMKGGYAFIGTDLLLHYYKAKDPDCRLAVGPDLEAFTEIAFPMQPDWPLRKDFNRAMYSMRDDGTLKNELQRWIRRTKRCVAVNGDKDDQRQLRLESFTGMFILLGVFYLLSYIVLFIKLGVLKLREKHEKLQKKYEGNVQQIDVEITDMPMAERTVDGEDEDRVSTL